MHLLLGNMTRFPGNGYIRNNSGTWTTGVYYWVVTVGTEDIPYMQLHCYKPLVRVPCMWKYSRLIWLGFRCTEQWYRCKYL
jgi:hypothetical protein